MNLLEYCAAARALPADAARQALPMLALAVRVRADDLACLLLALTAAPRRPTNYLHIQLAFLTLSAHERTRIWKDEMGMHSQRIAELFIEGVQFDLASDDRE